MVTTRGGLVPLPCYDQSLLSGLNIQAGLGKELVKRKGSKNLKPCQRASHSIEDMTSLQGMNGIGNHFPDALPRLESPFAFYLFGLRPFMFIFLVSSSLSFWISSVLFFQLVFLLGGLSAASCQARHIARVCPY